MYVVQHWWLYKRWQKNHSVAWHKWRIGTSTSVFTPVSAGLKKTWTHSKRSEDSICACECPFDICKTWFQFPLHILKTLFWQLKNFLYICVIFNSTSNLIIFEHHNFIFVKTWSILCSGPPMHIWELDRQSKWFGDANGKRG